MLTQHVQNMPKLAETLENLAKLFTVRSIMTDELLSANNSVEAKDLLKKNKDFDLIPIRDKGLLHSYLRRGSADVQLITIDDTIGDGTSILDLVDLLAKREFCFVIGKAAIAGYVHFSDLNNHIVKLPFFILMEALEQHIVREVHDLI